MTYTVLQCRPKEAEKKLNVLASQGWKVVAWSEAGRRLGRRSAYFEVCVDTMWGLWYNWLQ